LDEIRENEHNLNVSLYVYPEDKVEEIDVMKEWKELREIEKDIGEVEEEIKEYLREVYG